MSHIGTRVLALALVFAPIGQAASATQSEVAPHSIEGVILESPRLAAEREAERYRFKDLSVLEGLPPAYPRPASQWKEREKQRYQDLLAGGTYDLMVVPFQVHGYAFDRPTRSLMTAELTYALGNATGMSLPDPYLLARALGEGERQYDPFEVTQVARKLGVEEIVWAHVGHTREPRMNLIVQKLKVSSYPASSFPEAPGQKIFSGVTFSETESPIEIFHAMLPRILDALGVEGAERKTVAPASAIGVEFTLPDTPAEALSGASDDPVRDAYYLQLLAALAPEYAERTRERFAEKSLLALYRASPSSRSYRALKARAYMHLGLRPAAVSMLGETVDQEERALLAALNGNLPELRELAPRIPSKLARVLAEFDANRIAAKYGLIEVADSMDAAAALDLPGDIWPYLAARSMTDWEVWAQFENTGPKQLLDWAFPLANFTAKGAIEGAYALGDASEVQTIVDLSVVEHIERLMAAEPEIWCCERTPSSPGLTDYIDLIEAVATDNLMRRSKLLTSMQDLPSRSQDFLASIAGRYNGHPQFALNRGLAYAALAGKKGGADADNLSRQAHSDAFDASFWSNGQTRVAADAHALRMRMRRSDFGYTNNYYAADYPFRSFYPVHEGGHPSLSVENALLALQNSTHDFQPVRQVYSLLRQFPGPTEQVLTSIKGRFAGNTAYLTFMASRSLKSGKTAEAEQYYRQGIAETPKHWPYYSRLGRMFFKHGRVEEAFDLFMSWPGFQDSSEVDQVALANYAYDTGSLFYWAGHFDQAVPLYRISAETNTGASAEIASEFRLHLLEEEYGPAMQGMLARAKRYNSSYGYRDYLGMLHATENSPQAWNAFDLIVNRLGEPHVWETALTGHRREAASEEKIAEWAKRYGQFNSKTGDSYSAVYLLRAGVTDRIPSNELAKKIAEMVPPVWRLQNENRDVVSPSPDAMMHRLLGPHTGYVDALIPAVSSEQYERTEVNSDLAYFALAYRRLRLGEFAEAGRLLGEASELYNIAAPRFGYLLPYYAVASHRVGDMSDVERHLDRFVRWQEGFDFHLAKAVLAESRNETQTAEFHLDLALYRRPHTESRPLFTEYQYAEICELLYEATGKRAYKDRLLDWARRAQRFFPWHSWSHTMVAKYSGDPEERKSAIATGYFLDRNSVRLEEVSPAELQAALAGTPNLNPFLEQDRTERDDQHKL